MTITTCANGEHTLDPVCAVPADRTWCRRTVEATEHILTVLGASKNGVVTHTDLLVLLPMVLVQVLATAVRLLVDEDLVASYPLQTETGPAVVVALTAHGRQLLDERHQQALAGTDEGSA